MSHSHAQRTLSTNTDAPVVTKTAVRCQSVPEAERDAPVIADLLQPLKILAHLVVEAVRQDLRRLAVDLRGQLRATRCDD